MTSKRAAHSPSVRLAVRLAITLGAAAVLAWGALASTPRSRPAQSAAQRVGDTAHRVEPYERAQRPEREPSAPVPVTVPNQPAVEPAQPAAAQAPPLAPQPTAPQAPSAASQPPTARPPAAEELRSLLTRPPKVWPTPKHLAAKNQLAPELCARLKERRNAATWSEDAEKHWQQKCAPVDR